MATALLQPPTNASPGTALTLSQQAPTFFTAQKPSFTLPWPLSLLLNSESQEKWLSYENLFLACLRTGDNDAAYQCLETLTARFGGTNDRVMALLGMYQEATATDEAGLEGVLKAYDEILTADPSVIAIQKRRAALLRSMGRANAAVEALVSLLDSSPTDAEAWAELADCYVEKGMWEQAIFCLEEVLCIAPNAWNMQARMGEVVLLSAGKGEGADGVKAVAESLRRFCRSVELCDDYLRGYYGIKLTSDKLVGLLGESGKKASGDASLPSVSTVKKLNELAVSKLADIIRRAASGDKGWDGYSRAELEAARQLIEQNTQKIER